MQRIYLLYVLTALSMLVAGCETVKGIGKDLRNTGENINEAVNKI